MDPDQRIPRGPIEGLLLERFEPVTKPLQHRKVAVDQHVEQERAERVAALVADAGAAVANPVADEFEGIAGETFAKRDQIAVAEEDADRIGDDRIAVEPYGAGRHQHLVTKHLHLRPLVRRDGVLEGEFLDLEHVADQAVCGLIIEALDVDPDDRPLLPGDRQLLGTDDRRLVDLGPVAAEHP